MTKSPLMATSIDDQVCRRVFGISSNKEHDATLTLDDLRATIERVREANRVYYVPRIWCPKVDDEGRDIVFEVKFGDPHLFLVHPDHVPKLTESYREIGMEFVELPRDEILSLVTGKRPDSIAWRWPTSDRYKFRYRLF